MSQTTSSVASVHEEKARLPHTDIEQPPAPVDEKQPDTSETTAAVSPFHPSQFPDGGRDAYLCLLGGFCCLFCSFGWLNCVGVFQSYYQRNQLSDYSPSTIAWIASLEIFVMFAPGPIVGFIYDNYGPKYILLFGTFFHVFGLMMTSLCTEYWQFVLAQGICSPLGLNCVFQAGTSTIPTWFLKKRGLAFGVMVSGSGLGGIIFPIVATHLIPQIGYGWTMRTLAFLILGMMGIALLTVKSRLPPRPREFELWVFVEPFKDTRFILLTIASFLFFMGLFIPINFIEVEAMSDGMSTSLAGYLLAVLNAASMFGRIIPGALADKVGKFNMQSLWCLVAAILVLALALPASGNAAYITFAALYGFASGAFVSLLPAQIVHISKVEQIGVRVGVMFACISFAGLVGNPIAGAIVDKNNGMYWGLNIFSGVMLMAGSSIADIQALLPVIPHYHGHVAPTAKAQSSQAQPLADTGWRNSLPEITIGAILKEKDAGTNQTLFDKSFSYARSKGTSRDEVNGSTSLAGCYSNAARIVETQYLHSILPSKDRLFLVVDYYAENMMYWNGGIYHAPSFRRKLVAAYGQSSELNLQSLDWTWTALLFAILSSSIIGSAEGTSVSWGFSIDDKVHLARLWGAASISCLNLGNYTSKYSIHSVQTIYIMHAYEHLVGSSNQWIALRSVGVIIAKGLGLHRLGPHPDDERIAELTPDQKQAFVEREIGRRVWYGVVCQEWLCSTSQAACTLTLQWRHFTSARPRELDEETMMPLSNTATPTVTSVGRYFFDYAAVLLDVHNTMVEFLDQEDATKYAAIIKYDGEMRATCTEKVPECLSPRTPHDPNWPQWVTWARRLHQASVNHKIIMIHQHFLSKSFKDLRYTYSRWACVTAAQNIINLYNARDANEPQWWVEQAFVVTAGICMILELFHHAEADSDAQEYQACVKRAVKFLQLFYTSSVAVHGVRLLMSLLQEYEKLREVPSTKTTPSMDTSASQPCSCISDNIDDISIMDAVRTTHGFPLVPDMQLSFDDAFNFDIDALGFDDLMDYLPSVEGSLDNDIFHASMLTANGWPT
ncbi:hypothetical protein G6011_06564 [Alternaria panax]|uniref:Major facilitator superfamily (MFS) profile domain-containing protein n=1 Tax=Alternaria panax TaxID=48097 RepID=A0AAD4FHG0_9PLEO|nr:hypothetical protein G6011_06564 [Alternaria panax]